MILDRGSDRDPFVILDRGSDHDPKKLDLINACIFGLLLVFINSNVLEVATFCIFTCFVSSILSVLQLIYSPEVRRYLFY